MSMKDKLLTATGIASLMQTLGVSSEETKKAADILVDLEIGKSTHAETLTGGEQVKDRWDAGQMHKSPTAEEIKVGPTQHSSGGGAEKMIREYSNPAPQDGTNTVPERLAAELHHFSGYARALGTGFDSLRKGQEALTNVVTAMLTKQAGDAESVEPNEASQFAAIFASKAEQSLRAAKSVLKKTRELRDGLDEVSGADRKALKSQIRDLRKRAARLSLDALAATYAAKSEDADPAADVRKSLHDLMEDDAALKADMSAMHDKDKDKDEEKKTKKAIKRAAKKAAEKAAKKAAKRAAAEPPKTETTKADDKGNQADKQDPETKNQDDAAKKATLTDEDRALLSKALEGHGVLQGKLHEMFDLIAGRPTSTKATEPLELMKGEPVHVAMTLNTRIEEAVASGRLDTGAEMKARDLLQKSTAVREGALSEEAWKTMVRNSPSSVQEIFRQAA